MGNKLINRPPTEIPYDKGYPHLLLFFMNSFGDQNIKIIDMHITNFAQWLDEEHHIYILKYFIFNKYINIYNKYYLIKLNKYIINMQINI